MVFLFSCLCGSVLVPQKAEAVTFEQAQKYGKKIAAGSNHSLALKPDGSVVAWGYNGSGQCDIPTVAQSGVVAVAAGGHNSLALKSDGSVVAWGDNWYGQCNLPTSVQSGVVAVAAGRLGYHSLALKSDGSVVAWGYNGNGQCDIPTSAQSGVVAVTAGGYHSLALKSDGSVVAWGVNASGQCNVPTSVQSGVIAIAAGDAHSLALKSDGSVVVWGYNDYGQCDIPTSAQSGIVFLGCCVRDSAVLKSDGSVVVWGRNDYGQCNVPTSAQSNVVSISGGENHFLALKSDGSVVAWGDTARGRCDVPAGLCLLNQPPTIAFTSLPANSEVHKAETSLNFSIKASDPDGDQNLIIEFYLDTGAGFTKVTNFTANGTAITDGQLLAVNGTEYAIKIDKKALILPNVKSFKIKAITKDSENEQAVQEVSLLHSGAVLAGQWQLNEGTGTTAYDFSGYENHGIINGGATWVEGVKATGLSFDGVDDFINWSYNGGYPTDDFTLEAWVQTTKEHVIDPQSTENIGTYTTCVFGGSDACILVSVGTNGVTVYQGKWDMLPAPLAVYEGNVGTDWNHIVVTVKEQTPNIYINGQLVHTGLKSTFLSRAPYLLGSSNHSKSFFNGTLDEAAVYYGVLSAEEIGQRYSAGLPVLVGQWHFDEGAGTMAYDSSGLKNHGTINGGVTWAEGVKRQALNFDGVDDYVEVPLTPELTMTTNSFSVEAWVKTTDVPPNNDGIVGNYRSPSTPHWLLVHYGDAVADRGKFGFNICDKNNVNINIKTAIPMNDGEWHYLVGVRDVAQGKARFYVDGVLVGETIAPAGDVNSGQSIWIGEHYNRYFQGCIDEVAIHRKALSTEEIEQKYYLGLSKAIAEWHLDEGVGVRAYDSSGNGVDGTVTGGASWVKGVKKTALSFNGVDGHVSVPQASLNGLSNWSIIAWIKPEDSGTVMIYSEGNPWQTLQFYISPYNVIGLTTIYRDVEQRADGIYTGSNVIKRGAWNYIVATLENGDAEAGSGTAKIYVNGVLVKSGNLGKEFHSSVKEAAIGINTGYKVQQAAHAFKGIIDEVKLYSHVLSAEEILAEYNHTFFVNDMKLTTTDDLNNIKTVLYGNFISKLTFNLGKPVNALEILLDIPDNISVERIMKVYKDAVELDPAMVTLKEGNKLFIKNPEQGLSPGDYELQILLCFSNNLFNIKTSSFNDTVESINHETDPLTVEFVDLPDLL